MERKIVITVSGLHGVGKSVYARKIAERYGLRYVSSGMLFRRYAEERGLSLKELTDIAGRDRSLDEYIDRAIVEEAEKGDVVADGLLTGWMLRDKADIKFWFKARDDVRFRRIAERDGIPLEKAIEETKYREASEVERFKRYYNIDLNDLSIYDYVIDTSFLSIDDVLAIVFRVIDSYLARVGRKHRP